MFPPTEALRYLCEPPSTLAETPLFSWVLVTMFTAPSNEEVPYVLAAGPSRISILSISLMSTGKSPALCPVWGSLMLTPFRRMAIWSKVPPRMLMSVCIPITPLWRTSTPTANLRRSFMLFAGIVDRATLSRTVTILALWLSVSGTLLPVTDMLSRVYTVSCGEVGLPADALMAETANKAVVAIYRKCFLIVIY